MIRQCIAYLVVVCSMIAVNAAAPANAQQAPFRYVWGKAFHILPETHSDESGYFSLCEGLDGKIYVGTAKYNHNSYLVEFDPKAEEQRIVIDTHRVCGLSATGYASQAKIHTRNFVGPSGVIYVGSKQGYRAKGDTSDYPGGYVMTYDPASGRAENLGMPYKAQGIADVVADEARDLMYVVTCEDQHWMLYNAKSKKYRELGPLLTPYATTLIDADGRANVITKDFQLAQYDPASDRVTIRAIEVDGKKFQRASNSAIPTWNLAADGRTAYLIVMDDPTLIAVELLSGGSAVKARGCGKMIDGNAPDSRCALSIAPDGLVYAIVRVNNDTKFGGGFLHHLVRYDPKSSAMEDLGVLAVKNPDFFDFGPNDAGKRPPWSHGFHKLPDGTLAPLHHHMAMIVAADGTIYVTIIYPFTLLRIDQFRRRT